MSITDENSECKCSHDNDFSGLSISSFKECCIDKTVELNNSNSFIKDSKNNQNQLMNYTLISNDLLVKEFSENNTSSFNNIIPYKSDIPILISALLI